jgi:hypothetical protein
MIVMGSIALQITLLFLKIYFSCAAIGGEDLATCSKLVTDAWAAQRAFLVMASQCKKPADVMGAMKACGVVDACGAASKV